MKRRFKDYLSRIGIWDTAYSGKEQVMYITTNMDRVRVMAYIFLYPETLPFTVKIN